ncbi:MAG: transcriptional regulator [Lachnospiraceae bacterium]|jgi:pro-sigmaK processing inhibitor BofA|nr:transcriptional regulator [Lachnospiraceae bacterium]
MDYGVIAIVAICALVLMIGALKQKSKVVFQFVMRGAVGLVCIYFCNEFLETRQLAFTVGINPVSFLTAGCLGIGGVLLLYGIMFYQTL